ncbi:MAG TPA: DNA-binding protein [Candidatus Caldiarchaeum subterraneum]|uniref:DNA-binding protein n=1 Tax=Caldiarchaeum subterraneum TaxID=311458 RepID=A0A832ZXC9_CALS0|nr:DNA-binding protein [Candidatus Caldarchaeum subterraneum]
MIRDFFLEKIKEKQLTSSTCPRCNNVYFPPVEYCPRCLNKVDIKYLPLRGKIETYSEVSVATGFFKPGYTVAIVDINGLKIPGIVKDAKYDEIKIGDEVEVVFEKYEGYPNGPEYWYYFKLRKR